VQIRFDIGFLRRKAETVRDSVVPEEWPLRVR
jgi:hypothetical protein